MPHDKQKNKITWKEYFSRWKNGIKEITPIQKIEIENRGTFISLVGLILSLLAVIWQIKMLTHNLGWMVYGMILVFIGSIISTGLKYIAIRQSIKQFKQIDKDSEPAKIVDMLEKIQKEAVENKEGEVILK